jgi:hypothetical protein
MIKYRTHREPYEIELGRIAIAAAAMLARDMDEVFQDLTHKGAITRLSPRFQAAEAANRTVVLCRALIEEIRRYEQTGWWEEDDVEERDDDDTPF